MKRWYKLEEITGKILASYAMPQPHIPDLVYLEEPSNPLHTIWNGSAWELDFPEYKITRKNELKEAIKAKGFFEVMEITGFTADQVVTAWGNFKTNLATDTTKEEVDARVDGVYVALQLTEN